MDRGTAKAFSTISAASERTGGLGGGEWEAEGHRVVWHLSGYPIRRETVGGVEGEQEREVLWKDRAEDFQRRIESKKLRARP